AAFCYLEVFVQCEVKLSERGATQDVAPSIPELAGGWYRKRTWIEPACRITRFYAIRAGARVRVTDQVWPLRNHQRSQIGVVIGKHRCKREIAMNVGNGRNLPAAKVFPAPQRQLINNGRSGVMPNIEI